MWDFNLITDLQAVHITPIPDKQNLHIDIHHWGSDGQNIVDVAGYLASDNPRQSSAHLVAWAGTVYKLADWNVATWHAGDWTENTESISIECHPEMTDADIETVAQVIAMIRYENGNLALRKHSDFIVTECPGRWANMLAVLDAKANEYLFNWKNGENDMFTEDDRRKINAIFEAVFTGGTDTYKGKSLLELSGQTYAAVFDGGESMPDHKPMKDFIADSFTEVRNEIAALPKTGA